MMERVEALRVLGLGDDATPGEIQSRWRDLIRAAHSDHGGNGDGEVIDRLVEARDAALRGPGTALARRDLGEIVKLATKPLVEWEEQRVRHERADRVQRQVVRIRVGRVKRERRQAGLMTAVAGAVTIFGQLFNAVGARSHLPGNIVSVVAAAWAIGSGSLIWMYTHRADRLAEAAEDVADALSDPLAIRVALDELKPFLKENRSSEGELAPVDESGPWRKVEFVSAVRAWMKISMEPSARDETMLRQFVSDLVAPDDGGGYLYDFARRLGVREFSEILLARGVEHQVLEELRARQVTADGQPREVDLSLMTQYRYR
jgi:hypothetical protein